MERDTKGEKDEKKEPEEKEAIAEPTRGQKAAEKEEAVKPFKLPLPEEVPYFPASPPRFNLR